MSSTVSTLRSKFKQCICASCEDSRCILRLSAFPSQKIILNIDCITQKKLAQIRGERCDRLVVVEERDIISLLPVEFKTTLVKPDKVKKQLEGGIRFFKSYHTEQFNCYPVLVSKSLKGSVRKKLQQVSISCNGKTARIKHVLCNRSLSWNAVSGNRKRQSW